MGAFVCVVSFFGCSLEKRFLPSLGNGSRLSFGQQGQGYAWQWPCRNNPAMGGLLRCSAEAQTRSCYFPPCSWENFLASLPQEASTVLPVWLVAKLSWDAYPEGGAYIESCLGGTSALGCSVSTLWAPSQKLAPLASAPGSGVGWERIWW